MSDPSISKELGHTPRRTVQRDAVLDALRTTDAFISAQELFEAMNTGPFPVSLSTVYRHLNSFVESGEADTTWRDHHQLFRACGEAVNHVHAVCATCGEESQLDRLPELLTNATKSRGFVIEHMMLEIVGRCDECITADNTTE